MSRATVSSSRRSVVELLSSLLIAELLAPFLSPGCARRPTGPLLRVTPGAPPDPASADTAPPTLWLALTALDGARRSALLDELEGALASAEARANPLLVDLLGEDPRDTFRRAQAWFLPLCTAAHGLLSPRYVSPDGLLVEALPRGTPPTASDVPAWGSSPDDATSRRARFLAWPVSCAVVVRGHRASTRAALDESLRRASADPARAIGLVATSGALRGETADPRVTELLVRLARAGKRGGRELQLELAPTLPERGKNLVRWVELTSDEWLVVPKLSALSPAGRFRREVTEILGEDAIVVVGTG